MKEIVKHVETNEPGMMRQIMFRFFPYWPLFLVLIILGFTGATLYMRYTKPLYEVSSTILVKDEKKGVDDAEMMESLNMYGSKKIVENEVEVLQSRAMMHAVVNKMALYAPVYEDKKLVPLSAYNTSPVTVLIKDPDHLKETAKVYFAYDSHERNVIIGRQRYPLNNWFTTRYGIL